MKRTADLKKIHPHILRKIQFIYFLYFQAAILQQTAQYIIDLEREKTQLLTQNCQLKRLMDQQDGSIVEVIQPTAVTTVTAISAQQTSVPISATTQTQSSLPNKKRKLDSIYAAQTISDSSDEGLGSMSPEPTLTLVTAQSNHSSIVNGKAISAKDYIEMKSILEIERRKNMALEERLRQYTECHPVYTNERVAYQHQEVIEHTDNLRQDADDDENMQTVVIDKIHHNMQNVHVLSLDSIPTVGQTQVVVCSTMEDEQELMEQAGLVHSGHIDDEDDDDSRTMSPCMMNSSIVKEEVIITESRPNSPMDSHAHLHSHARINGASGRLQPILEAAIKAEPKVEVERINSPNSITVLKDCTTESNIVGAVGQHHTSGSQVANNRTATTASAASRMYITNTSRQNLETIVEAIRHLEGDQLFGEMAEPTQEVPLALTNKPQQQLQIEMNPFLQFRPANSPALASANHATTTAAQVTTHGTSSLLHAQLQHPQCINIIPQNSGGTVRLGTVSSATVLAPSHIQPPHPSINNRPGVIVVKQNS